MLLSAIAMLVVLWYIGSVISIIVFSETITDLERVRPMATIIPIVAFLLFFKIVFGNKPFKERMRAVYRYVFKTQKYLCLSIIYVEALDENLEKYTQKFSEGKAKQNARKQIVRLPPSAICVQT